MPIWQQNDSDSALNLSSQHLCLYCSRQSLLSLILVSKRVYFSHQFPRCTQAAALRRENNWEKGCLDQPFQGAQMKEALRQPKSTMPCAASKIKAINAIIKNHQDGVRRPRHQGAGLTVQEAQASEGFVVQMLPQRQQTQVREPLRQPKKKINCAASVLKAINKIHRQLKLDSERPPKATDVSQHDLQSTRCAECTTAFQ